MTRVYLELGPKKVFACAVDWAGWCRIGKTEELALEAFVEYAPRYRVIAERAGIEFKPGKPSVVERVRGNATTDFGAPGAVPKLDRKRITTARAKEQVALVRAAWKAFDDAVAATPAELRKGPRGGGRDRDKMVAHVIGAERAYANKIGIKHPPLDVEDVDALASMRADVVDLLSGPSDGKPLRPKGWPARYATRRIAWHVVDHLWEMEDRRGG